MCSALIKKNAMVLATLPLDKSDKNANIFTKG